MNPNQSSYSRFSIVLLALAVAAAYYISARIGLMFAFENSNSTPVWAPSGIALAALFLFGARIWWGIMLGAFAVNIVVFLSNNIAALPTVLWVSSVISIGNTLEAIAGYFLLKKFNTEEGCFQKTSSIFNFVLIGLAVCLISSSIGPTAVALGNIIGWEQYPTTWFTWWFGDVTGIFLFTPFLLSWLTKSEGRKVKYDWRKTIEATGLLIALFLVGGIIYWDFFSSGFALSRTHLVIPFLLWAALRFGLREVTTLIILIAAMAVWGAAHGEGPFQYSSINEKILSVQEFIAIIGITFLILVAALNERRTGKEKIKEAHAALETLIKKRNGELLNSKKEMESFRERTAHLQEILLKTTLLDFSRKAKISGRGDELDAIAAGLNTMSEELESHLKKLQDSEEKFKGLLESAPDAIVIVDENGIIQLVNAQTEKMFGFSKSEMLGEKVELLIPGNFHKVHPEHRKKYFENPKVRAMGIGFDLSGKRKNGEEFPVEISLSPMETSGGILVLAAIRDITSRKAREGQIRYQASLIANIQDAAISTDNNLIIQSWNKGAEITYGWTAGEVLGKEASQFLKTEYPENGNKEKAIEEFRREDSYKQEVIQSRKDGKRINIFTTVNALKNEKGEITGMVAINRDITDLKLAGEQLKEREEQIRTIFQNAPEAVIVINENSIIQEWNPFAEKIFGWQKDEVIGKPLYEIIIPIALREAHKQGLKKYLETGEEKVLDRPIELPALRKDGTEFPAGISISPLVFRGQRFFIGFITDISGRKKAEEELRKKSEELTNSNKELEQFAYVASHDLQEPLRMVTSYVQLLEKRYKDKLDADANDFIRFAVDGSTRMRKLINSLLEYSRINRIKPFEKINTNQLLLDVLTDLKEGISESKAEIKIEKLPDIFGDPVLIAQLFQNLINNAIKFRSAKPPEIVVSGKSINGELQFSVKDNGIGIGKEYFDKIFVIFQRLHTKEQYPGTGIGLAISKKIVDRHGGKIWVESETGKGSTFYFTVKKN